MSSTMANSLEQVLAGSPFVAYSYAYPHKTAYRPLTPMQSLRDVWSAEAHDALFLYLHIPFCEYRCGFCNLFTLSQPEKSLTTRYLAALAREAEAVRDAIDRPQYARMAIGGGTPTFLTIDELEALFRMIVERLGARPGQIPVSCEASPATLSAEKLAFLRERGVDRLSLGIQSFNEHDAHAMGRPQARREVEQALTWLHEVRFPTVNLDLIYGGRTQTRESWLDTVEEAVEFAPQEIYLYPLYVRPLTGLAGVRAGEDWRLLLYRAAKERLLTRGYEQTSLRMFKRSAVADAGPHYCCQDDGMIGLGCGARSYTRELHYSREYAVKSGAVEGILTDYMQRSEADFARVEYGFWLNSAEQRRRLVILSLLQSAGLDLAHYRHRFDADVLEDFPQLLELLPLGLATLANDRLQLTERGLEWSDAIGPWLYSPEVNGMMEEYAWR